jgi:hypothetical protein
MQQLDELKAFIASPQTTPDELQELLRSSTDQLGNYENARKVIHDAGFEGWTFEVYQESLSIGSDNGEGSVTKPEWDMLRPDARQRLRDRSLYTLNQGRQTFEELQVMLNQELARRAANPAAAGTTGKKPRRRFWKR